MKNKSIELLSPGGSRDAVIAAVNSGCDAVYLGGKYFNARNQADNFNDTELREVIDYCHLRGVKVYLAVNTLYKESELNRLFGFVAKAVSDGVDALIMQDMGAFSFLKKHFPDMSFHASTQMTAHSLNDAIFLTDAGFDRIILSRELSIDEIRNISQNCDAEFEVFVHGALCYSYSGACLMSSFYGDRSGNRGNCAQPCRLKYTLMEDGRHVTDNAYLLSPKDIVTLDNIKNIAKAGVSGLKIEGRLKSAEYVGIVTGAYRAALDCYLSGTDFADVDMHKKKTARIFGRGGFSEGYFNCHSSAEMMSELSPKHIGTYVGAVSEYNSKTKSCTFITKTKLIPGDGIEIWTENEPHCGAYVSKHYEPNDKVIVIVEGNIRKSDRIYKSYDKAINDEGKDLYSNDRRKLPVMGGYICESGKEFSVSLSHDGISVKAFGEKAQKAEKQPLTNERIIAQLEKSGGYPFDVTVEDGQNDGQSFLNVSAINAVRRQACEMLAESIIGSYKRDNTVIRYSPVPSSSVKHKKTLSVLVRSKAQLRAAMCVPGLKRIYVEKFNGFEDNVNDYAEECKKNGADLFAALPQISRGNGTEKYLNILEKTPLSGYLVRNLGQLEILKNSDKLIASDFNMNVSNSLANEFMLDRTSIVTPSIEISVEELEFVTEKNELIVYGRIPLMTTALCPVGIYSAKKGAGKYCAKKGTSNCFSLVDRMGSSLPVLMDCSECYSRIFSDRPLYMLNKLAKLIGLNAGGLRLDFLDEEPEIITELIKYTLALLDGKTPISLVAEKIIESGINYGHYFKVTL